LETLELLPKDHIEHVHHDGTDVVVAEKHVYTFLEKDMKWVSL
jgi:hypothetical protein